MTMRMFNSLTFVGGILLLQSSNCSVEANDDDEITAKAYKAGYEEGTQRTTSIWKRSYNEDCFAIFAFSVEVQDKVIHLDYKSGYNTTNKQSWWFYQGGRDGAQDTIKSYQMKCLDPMYCDELGTTAAELIVSDFCQIPGAFGALKERTPVSMCRIASRRSCQGKMWNVLQKFTEEVDCKGLPDNIESLSTKDLLYLQDECNDQVDDMIEWDELDDEWSNRHNDKESVDKDLIDTRNGCEDYDEDDEDLFPETSSSSSSDSKDQSRSSRIGSSNGDDSTSSSKGSSSKSSSSKKGKKKKKKKKRSKSRKQLLRNRA